MKNKPRGRGLSRGRAAVFEALRAQPDPVDVPALARALGRHPNTVREQVTWLVEHGLVERLRRPGEGRGRPSWVYRAHGPRPGEDEHAELTADLIWRMHEAPEEETDRAALARAAEQAGRRMAAELVTARGIRPESDALSGRRRTVDLLDDLGYEPESDAACEQVVLRRCPLLQAAHQFTDVVCEVHLGLVREALDAHGAPGDEASLQPFSAPGECALELHPSSRDGS